MKTISLFVMLLFFVFCQTQEKETAENTNSNGEYQEVKTFIVENPKNESEKNNFPDTSYLGDSQKNIEIMTENKSAKAVVEFLKWYQLNHQEIEQIIMVNNLNWEDGDSTKPYSVNFKETEKYLNKLKSSGFISGKYLQKWKKYFEEKDENFKVDPQYYGPPIGFEFDFVLWTQIIDETLNMINYYQFLEINELGNRSNVKINIGMKLNFTLTKHNAQWLIDNIENLGM